MAYSSKNVDVEKKSTIRGYPFNMERHQKIPQYSLKQNSGSGTKTLRSQTAKLL